jgi:hypothetical protein
MSSLSFLILAFAFPLIPDTPFSPSLNFDDFWAFGLIVLTSSKSPQETNIKVVTKEKTANLFMKKNVALWSSVTKNAS